MRKKTTEKNLMLFDVEKPNHLWLIGLTSVVTLILMTKNFNKVRCNKSIDLNSLDFSANRF